MSIRAVVGRLAGSSIDCGKAQRRRLQRLFVVAQNTELLGLGIDEDTALIVRGHVGEVVGAGGVTFVDGRATVRFDNAHQIEKVVNSRSVICVWE